MIFDAILNAFRALFVSILDLLPDYTLPDLFPQALGIWVQVLSVVGDLSYWIPLGTVATMGGAVFAAVGLSITIRLVRIAVAYFPTMGGSQQ